MGGKNKWWTIQLIPHGKGKIQSFKVQSFPIMILLYIVLFTTLIAIGMSFFLWNVTKEMDVRMDEQKTELTQYMDENNHLKERLSNVNQDLNNLNVELQDLQQYIEEMERLEQQIKNLEGSTSPQSVDDEERQVKQLLMISSYDSSTTETASATPDMLRQKINDLKDKAEQQQHKLSDLKEQIEEEQYKALFVPTIPPANGRISSSFGIRRDPFHGGRRMHNGIDFVNYYRAPIFAAAHGKVTFAGRNSSYGNQIVINHGNGYKTTYSHLSSISVKKGEQVEMGDVIGKMGSTGRSTGVHLHYEVHKNGKPVNPISYIKGSKK